MPDFCSENTELITDANYMEKYSTGSKISCLPHNGNGFSSVENNGMVNKSELDRHVTALLAKANAEAPGSVSSSDASKKSTSIPSAFAENSAKLRKDITTEYCFYYKRYIYVLHDILMSAATLTEGSKPPDYIKKKENTEKLNGKLNQILQVLQSLVNSRLTTLKGYYGPNSGVNELNSELNTTRNELIKHSTLLKNTELEKDARAAMIDYSVEKNQSSRNLLAIYGFMNIVAVGLVFYLYRSQ